MKRPLRILNEPPAFFGLGIFDLAVIGWVLIISHSVLDRWGVGFLSLAVALLFAAILISIRMRFRRKIIRDSARLYLLSKNR